MHTKGKSIFAALVSLLMLFTLLAPQALAQTLPESVGAKYVADESTHASWSGVGGLGKSSHNVGRIWTDKTVATDSITLSGNVTTTFNKQSDADFLVGLSALSSASNMVSTTWRTDPLDIVLVLDTSGSMAQSLYAYEETYDLETWRRYYVNIDGEWEQVQYSNGGRYEEGWYYTTGYNNRYYVTPKTSASDNTPDRVQFYTRDSITKMDALKSAVDAFIDETAARNAAITEQSEKHRIALVKFASDENNAVGNDTNDWGYNDSQVVSDFVVAEGQSAQTLSQTVNRLTASGATQADYGLNHAKRLMNGEGDLTGARADAKKIVIFFTDGQPTSGQNFESEVAAGAVNNAYDLKHAGATVYSIGVFEEANPSDTYGNFNRYMNAVSSNYPTAQCGEESWWDQEWSQTNDFEDLVLGTRVEGKDYYFAADSAEGLNEVFQAIADDATSGSGYPTEVEEGAADQSGAITFTDTLGPYMEIKEAAGNNAARTIQVVFGNQTINSNGKQTEGDTTTYTFPNTQIETDLGRGNIRDLVVTVKHSNDAATGDVVTVSVPASLIPVRYYNIDNKDPENATMAINDAFPIRVFYSVGLKDAARSALAGDTSALGSGAAAWNSYVASHTGADGNINFYSNAWGGTDGAATTATFTPNGSNKFYYYTEDTLLYTDENCTDPATEADLNNGTLYYKNEYFAQTGSGNAAEAAVEGIAVDTANLTGRYETTEGGQLYLPAGEGKLSRAKQFEAKKNQNATKTSAYVTQPAWVNGDQDVQVTLGNNGLLQVPAASLIVAKKVTADTDLTAPDKDFTFTVTAGNKTDTVTATKTGTGVAANGEAVTLTFTDGQATFILKAGQQLEIPGMANTAYTVTETAVDGFAVNRITSTNAADTTNTANRTVSGTVGAAQDTSVTFTNHYSVQDLTVDAETDLGLKGTKTITGRDFQTGDSFSFTIAAGSATSDAPLPMKDGAVADTVTIQPTSGNKQSFAFDGTITYTKPGTYYYLITENTGNLPGVTYNSTNIRYRLTVTVTDNQNGTMKAESKLEVAEFSTTPGEGEDWTEATEIAFTNAYSAQSVNVAFGGTKSLTGGRNPALKDEEFAFVLTGEGNAPVPAATEAQNAGQGRIRFEAITFDQDDIGQTYTYHVTEKQPTEDGTMDGTPLPGAEKNSAGQWVYKGVTYDNSTKTITVKVDREMVDGTETVKVDVTGNNFTFTNTYAATGSLDGATALKVSKTLNGRNWKDGEEFTFTIAAADANPGAPLPRVTEIEATEDNQTPNFGDIAYTEADIGKTYTYTITETAGADNVGLTYSQAKYEVEVTVTDKGDGTLNVTSTMTKVAADNGTAVNETVTNNTAAFTNTYTATFDDSTAVTVIGTKQLKVNGGASMKLENNDFRFTIQASDNSPTVSTTSTNDAPTGDAQDGVYTANITLLSDVEYTSAGIYTYLITEDVPAKKTPGMTYDEAAYKITVTVTDDGNGKLSASAPKIEKGTLNDDGTDIENATDANSVLFANSYTPESVTIGSEGRTGIGVRKTFTGREWKDSDKFTFTLTAKDGAPMPADATGNTATVAVGKPNSGTVNGAWFGDITYDTVGTYTYTVTENAPADVKGIAYDSHTATVTVAVTEGSGENAGKLVASVSCANTDAPAESDKNQTGFAAFTNTYRPNDVTIGKDTGDGIQVEKVLKGRDWNNDSFTFTLAPQGEAPMPTDDDGKQVTITGGNETEGTGISGWFGNITYTFEDLDAGQNTAKFTYTITEIAGTDDNITYDTKQQTVTVTLTYDQATGKLTAAVDPAKVTITNTYTPDPITPSLGLGKTLTVTQGDADKVKVENYDFNFTVYSDAAMENKVATAANNGGTISIANLTQITKDDVGKTISYYIKEEEGTIGGITYSDQVFRADIKPTYDAAAGTLDYTVAYYESTDGGQNFADTAVNGTPTFENTYYADGVQFELTLSKELTGRDDSPMRDGEFSFELEDENGNTIPATNQDGLVKFQMGFGDGVTQQEFKALLKAANLMPEDTEDTTPDDMATPETAAPDGETAEPETTEPETPATETTEPETTEPETPVTETTEPETTEPETPVTETTEPETPATETTEPETTEPETPVTETTEPETPATETTEPEAPVTETTEPETPAEDATDGADEKTEQTTETVEESTADVPTDPQSETSPEGADVELQNANRREHAQAQAMTPAEAQAKIDSICRDYTFTARETSQSANGVTTDTTEYTIVVTVTDNGQGSLVATLKSVTEGDGTKHTDHFNTGDNFAAVQGKDTIGHTTFTNTYTPDPTTIGDGDPETKDGILVQKTLTGREWLEGESFTFTLNAVTAGAPMPKDATVSIGKDANGLAEFGEITYDKAGVYEYTVTETPDATHGGMTYDTHSAKVTVTVTDDYQGHLSATVAYSNADAPNPSDQQASDRAAFTNSYKATPEPKDFAVNATKIYKNGTLKEGAFTFQIAEAATGKVVATATNAADGSIRITLPVPADAKEGTIDYVVSEVKGSEAWCVYDETTYRLQLVLTDDNEGTLHATLNYPDGESLTFTNTYDPPAPVPVDEHPDIAEGIKNGTWGKTPTPAPAIPQTSDDMPLGALIVIMVAAAAAVVVLVVLRRKRKQ